MKQEALKDLREAEVLDGIKKLDAVGAFFEVIIQRTEEGWSIRLRERIGYPSTPPQEWAARESTLGEALATLGRHPGRP